ncbi:DUF1697 domain-containing protein [Aeromicrobium sp. YIM 150415]|uniref:DUF1697 domain-containing protein n=1 Tax=Aeromicrobium sp. YIM 150415 TaxID=2803912 RepID=UPI001966CE0C|nr:DUF1697 domain-containing protein [Aeromicrobium sp. YIM 150415]MBM9463322.1 DUF1697 domain-containing protein [Aeromicrobium sp. YIM 150415]
MAEIVVLLRAVNVGGAKLPMARLREIAAELGASDISTHIASGNLLCTPGGGVAEFARGLERRIADEFGFSREAIVRTPAELTAALDAYPFDPADERRAHIHFLYSDPTGDAEFTPAQLGDDEARLIGRDLHLRFGAGAGQTKLTTAVLQRALGAPGTARNLRTVRALIEKAQGT